ncbi:MAG: hypothetical protein OHK0013_37130 [Sandaracinaceae bacterium]
MLTALLIAGCPVGRTDVVVTHPDAPPLAPFDTCTVMTAREPSDAASHVPVCTALAYEVPPVGGTHYAQWADYGVYDAPVPWGFLVHAMEHGAVVVAYRCTEGLDCAALRSELEAIVAARPADPLCRDDDRNRIVLAPAPDLEWPIAVLAWEHVYVATCLDRPSIDAFFDAHYARGPEDTCAPGVDLSAMGWCGSG